MKKLISICAFFSVALFLTLETTAGQQQSNIVLDEDVWILFYDVPSRRFRRTRDAFVRRDWASAANDLQVSAGFVRAEASRSVDELSLQLENIADRLDAMSEGLDGGAIKGSDLDNTFARTHWLLAQHYLELARFSRDEDENVNAGSYLWATAHHMERTVLWSDARMTRRQIASLDQIRDLAASLRQNSRPADALKQRPVVKAYETLRELGEFLDRKVWIE